MIGVRLPDTVCGSWENAFIVSKNSGKIKAGVFDNCMDHIGYPKDDREVVTEIKQFLDKGYLFMSKKDIEETFGKLL